MADDAAAAKLVEYTCFVEGLALTTTDQGLNNAFSQYGAINDSSVINDRETGISKGYGVITFEDEQSLINAINGMNGRILDGSVITVKRSNLTADEIKRSAHLLPPAIPK